MMWNDDQVLSTWIASNRYFVCLSRFVPVDQVIEEIKSNHSKGKPILLNFQWVSEDTFQTLVSAEYADFVLE